MADASSWIDNYVKYLALIPALLIFGDWIYGRIALRHLRMQYDKQTREYDKCKESCAEIAKELDRANQTVTNQGITFLANDFRTCSMYTNLMPICPNCFPEHTIYLHQGPGVGDSAPQELKDRFERDYKNGTAFASYLKCPICKFETRLINKKLEQVQKLIFDQWPKPLG